MSSGKSLVINCGASHVSYAVVNRKASGVTLDELYIEPLNYDFSDEEGWLSAVCERIKSIASRSSYKGDCTLIAPGYQLLTKIIKVPHVEPEKQSQIVAFEAQQNIPYPLGEVVWGHQVISDDGVEAEVILIAFKAVAAHAFCKALANLGLNPISVQPASILDYNAYRSVYGDSPETTMMINIGARSSSILFIGSDGFFVRNIALGGNTLTQAIADGTGQSFLQAEQAKVAYFYGQSELAEGDLTLQVIHQASETFLKRLGQEITRSIVNYKRQRKGNAPTSILLNGAGSLMPGLQDQLANTQGVTVDYFDPTQVMTPSGQVNAEFLSGYFFQLSEVLGAISKETLPDAVGIELLPRGIAQDQAFKKKKTLLILAAACLPLAPLPLMLNAHTTAGKYEEAVKDLKRSTQPYEKRYKKITGLQEHSNQLVQKISKYEEILKSKENWVNFFVDLQQRLFDVKDVWIDELEVIRSAKGFDEQSYLNNRLSAEELAALPLEPEVYKIELSGRMLLRVEGSNKGGGLEKQVASGRLSRFKDQLTESEFIKSVETDELDFNNPRVMRFTLVLDVDPNRPL